MPVVGPSCIFKLKVWYNFTVAASHYSRLQTANLILMF